MYLLWAVRMAEVLWNRYKSQGSERCGDAGDRLLGGALRRNREDGNHESRVFVLILCYEGGNLHI